VARKRRAAPSIRSAQDRCWAIEAAGGLGRLLAQQLLAQGQHVIDVPPTLAARVRLLGSSKAGKSDPNDALAQAEEVTRKHCGFSEIDYERAKQLHRDSGASSGSVLELDDAARAFERDAATRGVDYVTFRRMAEAIAPTTGDAAAVRRHLIATRPDHYDWPLWSLTANPSIAHRDRAG
jgi:transposase